MAKKWLCPDQVFDGQSLRRDMAVGLDDGMVSDLVPISEIPSGGQVRKVSGIIAPGYLDLQVNGGGGVLLNNHPTVQAMQAIAAAHRVFGTVGVMPTVITDAPVILARAVDAAVQAKGMAGVLGLHIEGPHISLTRRGTHAAAFIRPMDASTLAHIARLRDHGIAVMITLAPEMAEPGQIAQIVALGAVVSIGHSQATPDQVAVALVEGASCFTHLFNAMSPMLGRAAGVTGAAINSSAYCGFICDGQHVGDDMLGLAIRARPLPDRMVLVSDAMATVGGPDQFQLYGKTIRLSAGRLINDEGSLAGANVTMAEGVARLILRLKIPIETALRMAISTPAAIVGKKNLANVVGRQMDDLIVLGKDCVPQRLRFDDITQ